MILKVGDKVHYTPGYGDKENGIVKSINESQTTAWVVYKYDNKWEEYANYTGCATNIEDLTEGWIEEIIEL